VWVDFDLVGVECGVGGFGSGVAAGVVAGGFGFFAWEGSDGDLQAEEEQAGAF
jgi:hypothetical protein